VPDQQDKQQNPTEKKRKSLEKRIDEMDERKGGTYTNPRKEKKKV